MKTKFAALALGVALIGVSGAFAQTEIVNFSSVTQNFTNGAWTLGFDFQVNTPILVTGLSAYDANANGDADTSTGAGGLNAPTPVGLWTSGGTLIDSTTVTLSDPLDGDFRVQSVTPFVLGVGDYVVGSESGSSDYTYSPNGFTTIPEITFLSDEYQAGGTLAFPSNFSGVIGWFGGNVQAEAAPDYASTLALLSMGLTGLAAIRRRKSA